MNNRNQWLKLDLSGNVYPTLQRKSFSSVFRVSVTLKEKVDPQILQKAYEKTLPRFPSLKVALRKGLFWRYLEPNKKPGAAGGARCQKIHACRWILRQSTAI